MWFQVISSAKYHQTNHYDLTDNYIITSQFSFNHTLVININHLKKELKKAIEKGLPGSNSHKKMLPPKRKLSYPQEESKHIKKSSVLILIYPDGEEIYTCLMKRPESMKHHPGQISFPGGQVEPKDKNEVATALREANEEIGLKSDYIEVIGTLSKLYISVSGFDIYPVVAFTGQKPSLHINKEEVQEMYFLPLLAQITKYKFPLTSIQTKRGKLIVPCINFENEIIWGATAMILAELLDILRGISIKQE